MLWTETKEDTYYVFMLWTETKEDNHYVFMLWTDTKEDTHYVFMLWTETKEDTYYVFMLWTETKEDTHYVSMLWTETKEDTHYVFMLWTETKEDTYYVFRTVLALNIFFSQKLQTTNFLKLKLYLNFHLNVLMVLYPPSFFAWIWNSRWLPHRTSFRLTGPYTLLTIGKWIKLSYYLIFSFPNVNYPKVEWS
jgi:hypothetical protein